MPDEVGPHLLGRRPNVPDARDWKLASFLAPTPDLIQQGVAELKKTTVGYVNHYWTTPPPNSHWAKGLALLAAADANPPSDPNADVVWTTQRQLDQGDTGHCVGFGWAQYGNAAPVEDAYADDDGHAIYYEACAAGGYPNTEDGSTTRDGVKAMQGRGRVAGYAFAATVDEIIAWLRSKGPVVTGSDWDTPMFDPDANGYVKPNGDVAGGHEWLLLGHLPGENAFLAQNSWGDGWGLKGKFKIKVPDYRGLFSRQGDACVAIELPL